MKVKENTKYASLKTSQRIKIAYFCINDPLDKRSWSGITYYLGQTLHKNIGDVHFLGPVKIPLALDKTCRAVQKFIRFFFQTEWIPKYSFLKNLYAARVLKKRIQKHRYDFIIAPAAAPELACLQTNTPVIYFGDSTFKLYSTHYKKEFDNVNALSKWEGHQLEKLALKKSNLVILTSRWAARSAIRDYAVPEHKIEIMQFGANIDYVPNRSIIFEKETNKTLTLFFLSVDWERKGGPIAFETLRVLLQMGINTQLIVCGCTPPKSYEHPCMQIIPFLDKNKQNDFEKFVSIFSHVHFLLLPTRADCTPVVNSESNAYGVPSITTNVGGIADTVIDGVNGYCLPLSARGKDYAELIAQVYSNKKRYHALIESSRKRFEEELNWEKWAENFQTILKNHNLCSQF